MQTPLMKLLEAHLQLIDHGCRKPAETLANRVIALIEPTTRGGGLIDPLTAETVHEIIEGVCDTSANHQRVVVREIMNRV